MHNRHSLVFAALAVAALAGGPSLAADRKIERRVPVDARGTVSVSNVAGRIEIVGWDRPEVQVQGAIERDVERVDVLTEGRRTNVKVVIPRGMNSHSEAKLVVHVPRGSELEVSTVSADVQSKDFLGAQRLSTVSGEVRAAVGTGDVQVKTVSGDVVLLGRGAPLTARVETVSGDVTYEKGAGTVEIETVSGDAEVVLDPAAALRVSTTSGDLEFRGVLAPEARVEVQSMSGDLKLAVRAPAGLRAEVETFSGDLRNCFAAKVAKSSRSGPGERLSAMVGEGRAQIRLKTFSGDVDLCNR